MSWRSSRSDSDDQGYSRGTPRSSISGSSGTLVEEGEEESPDNDNATVVDTTSKPKQRRTIRKPSNAYIDAELALSLTPTPPTSVTATAASFRTPRVVRSSPTPSPTTTAPRAINPLIDSTLRTPHAPGGWPSDSTASGTTTGRKRLLRSYLPSASTSAFYQPPLDSPSSSSSGHSFSTPTGSSSVATPLSTRYSKTAQTPLNRASNMTTTQRTNSKASARVHEAFHRLITGPGGALSHSAEIRARLAASALANTTKERERTTSIDIMDDAVGREKENEGVEEGEYYFGDELPQVTSSLSFSPGFTKSGSSKTGRVMGESVEEEDDEEYSTDERRRVRLRIPVRVSPAASHPSPFNSTASSFVKRRESSEEKERRERITAKELIAKSLDRISKSHLREANLPHPTIVVESEREDDGIVETRIRGYEGDRSSFSDSSNGSHPSASDETAPISPPPNLSRLERLDRYTTPSLDSITFPVENSTRIEQGETVDVIFEQREPSHVRFAMESSERFDEIVKYAEEEEEEERISMILPLPSPRRLPSTKQSSTSPAPLTPASPPSHRYQPSSNNQTSTSITSSNTTASRAQSLTPLATAVLASSSRSEISRPVITQATPTFSSLRTQAPVPRLSTPSRKVYELPRPVETPTSSFVVGEEESDDETTEEEEEEEEREAEVEEVVAEEEDDDEVDDSHSETEEEVESDIDYPLRGRELSSAEEEEEKEEEKDLGAPETISPQVNQSPRRLINILSSPFSSSPLRLRHTSPSPLRSTQEQRGSPLSARIFNSPPIPQSSPRSKMADSLARIRSFSVENKDWKENEVGKDQPPSPSPRRSLSAQSRSAMISKREHESIEKLVWHKKEGGERELSFESGSSCEKDEVRLFFFGHFFSNQASFFVQFCEVCILIERIM